MSDNRSLLSQLTIIIPSYQRQPFLRRQCDYWRDASVKILMVDGSPEPAVLPGWLDSDHDRIRYRHMPTGFFQRLAWAAGQLETPYAAMLGDDEFFLPSGLTACIERLEAVSSHSCCNGQSIKFGWEDGHVWGSKGYPHAGYNVLSKSAEERLLDHFRRYTPTTPYAVLRTHVMKRALQAMALHEYSSGYVGELIFASVCCMNGTQESIDVLTWIRSEENCPVHSKEVNRALPFHEWYRDEAHTAEVNLFINVLSHELIAAAEIGDDSSNSAIASALEAYLSFSDRYFSAKKPKRALRWPNTPRALSRIARLFQGSAGSKHQRRKRVPISTYSATVAKEMTVSSKELNQFENCVTEFYNGESTRT